MLILSVAGLVVAASFISSIYGFYKNVNSETSPSMSITASAQQRPSLDMQNTLAAGWFSSEGVLQNIGSPPVVLELKGVSASDKAKLVGAYIAEPNKPEVFYREGDQLPSNAGKLSKVYSDHVAIERVGSSYTLAFPINKSVQNAD